MKIDELLEKANRQGENSSINSADREFESAQRARKVFSVLKTKLLRIDEWNAHALLSSYALFDRSGKIDASGKLEPDSFIRIALTASGKYDWIRVVDFYDAPDEFIVTVRPTFDPTGDAPDEAVTSHFFTDESTNNFCLYRKDQTVAFYVIGLNEKANTTETDGALETLRNAAVNAATYLGMQNSEWEKFCHHFLEDAAGNDD